MSSFQLGLEYSFGQLLECFILIHTPLSSKIDPILEEFADELAHIAPIPPGIVEADFDPNDDTSSDDDDFEDIEYVSLEEENDVDQEEKEFNLEDIFQIQDVILRAKLLNVHRLISNIESLKVNSTPDRVLESPSPFPIPVVDSDAFFEESDTSLSHSNNSLPEFESFSDHTEETRSGSTTTHANYSLPEFESFHFDNSSFSRPPPEPPDVEICLHFEPDVSVIDNFNELNDDQRGSEIDFSQNVEDDDSFTFDYPDFEDSRAHGVDINQKTEKPSQHDITGAMEWKSHCAKIQGKSPKMPQSQESITEEIQQSTGAGTENTIECNL
ncbi:hypothetical protein Tco_0974431 [Tanacetum coccineum]|uniref:Uncharacterized protein n=1 Tax=Tanacetum coccineum TaxID=301880 RepID=A0ABQ5EBJ9_9ASTR